MTASKDPTIELSLADEFASRPTERNEWSLPAALCDADLIQEIQAIPNKLGFKIGEVAELLDVKQYVLRYWETEFEVLRPKKASNNQRYYTKKDVENAFLVRKLLYRDRFSIEGARAAMKDLRFQVRKEKDFTALQSRVANLNDELQGLQQDLHQLKSLFL